VRRRHGDGVRRALPLVLVACLVPAGCSLRRHAAPLASPYCRGGDPLAGVYHAVRLHVHSRCRIATGIVDRVKFEEFDGDVHIDLRPDDTRLTNEGNAQLGGDLVVEIIPQDRALVGVPHVGERVTVVGPWVDDTKHGWMEIHPTWLVSPAAILPASAYELGRARLLLHAGTDEPS
jgi:hypothetical protein